MTGTPRPRVLRLRKEDQLTLVGLMLRLIAVDLEAEDDADKRLGRSGVRDRLRYLTRVQRPDSKPGHGELSIETSDVLARRLARVKSEAHGIQILIDAARFQPWQEQSLERSRRGELDGDGRADVLTWARDRLPGNPPSLKEVDVALNGNPNVRLAKFVLAGLGVAAAGAVTGGIAAPAIGGAIGGSMGFTGAVATNAGLAWLGGGALAAGGYGMAGGTTLIASLGAAGGGGLGAFAADQADKRSRAQLAVEDRKLRALVSLLSQPERSETTRAVGLEQVMFVEHEIVRLLNVRIAARLGNEEAGPLEADLTRVVELRRGLTPDDYPVESC